MRDIRNPTDVYLLIMQEKTAWHCSILEAADRVEAQAAESSSLTSPVTTNGLPPTEYMGAETGREKGAQ